MKKFWRKQGEKKPNTTKLINRGSLNLALVAPWESLLVHSSNTDSHKSCSEAASIWIMKVIYIKPVLWFKLDFLLIQLFSISGISVLKYIYILAEINYSDNKVFITWIEELKWIHPDVSQLVLTVQQTFNEWTLWIPSLRNYKLHCCDCINHSAVSKWVITCWLKCQLSEAWLIHHICQNLIGTDTL